MIDKTTKTRFGELFDSLAFMKMVAVIRITVDSDSQIGSGMSRRFKNETASLARDRTLSGIVKSVNFESSSFKAEISFCILAEGQIQPEKVEDMIGGL